MKSVFILSFLFFIFCMCKTVFLLKMVRKDKNTKSQRKKTVCEIMNFGSTNWSKPKKKKKNPETQHNGITFSYYLYNFVIYYFDS